MSSEERKTLESHKAQKYLDVHLCLEQTVIESNVRIDRWKRDVSILPKKRVDTFGLLFLMIIVVRCVQNHNREVRSQVGPG